ncbi:MAG: hypothetical protein K2P39_09900, partial [Lachnospiraceae bacterium]|nr:hypothetical protein [Lachnospiraceae bacterium]
MKKLNMIRKSVILMLCLCMLGLVACGEKEQQGTPEVKDEVAATTSSVIVNKDGSISCSIIEDFVENYYDEEGLKTMIETSISEYKAENVTAKVDLKSCKAKDGVVKVLMEYGDYQTYAGFNQEEFFAGTIQAANMAGFDLNVSLRAVSDKSGNTTISKPELLGMGDNHIVILGSSGQQEAEQIRVDCFDEILYVGD